MPAGGSAQQEYERRRARERERMRRALPVSVAFVVVGLVAGYLVTLAAVAAIDHAFAGSTRSHVQLVGPGLAHLAALVAGVALGGSIAVSAWGRRPAIEAWGRGAEGERRTARALAPLEREGFVMLHDRRLPGARWNVDHIVIGPAGVFVIETKHLSGKVAIAGDSLRLRGRSADAYLTEVWREAGAVQAVLARELATPAMDVRPILCVPGAELGWSRFREPVAQGVRVHGPRGMVRYLRNLPKRLTLGQVAELAAAVEGALPPIGDGGRLTS